MSNTPMALKYTKEHEWVQVDGAQAVVGITDFAQAQLGDVVFVELPKLGTALTQNRAFGVVESVKAVSDLFAPLSGTVTAVNDALTEHPELVNKDPYGQGWMVKVAVGNPGEVDGLLAPDAYDALTQAT